MPVWDGYPRGSDCGNRNAAQAVVMDGEGRGGGAEGILRFQASQRPAERSVIWQL